MKKTKVKKIVCCDHLYNGMFSDSEPFRKWLNSWFNKAKTTEDDKWWVRDYMSGAWNAALDVVRSLNLTSQDLIERADKLDAARIWKARCQNLTGRCYTVKDKGDFFKMLNKELETDREKQLRLQVESLKEIITEEIKALDLFARQHYDHGALMRQNMKKHVSLLKKIITKESNAT